MEESIKTLLAHAKALREAGVVRLTCFDVSVEFAPLAATPAAQQDSEPKEETPPGRDPVTYGFPEGTVLPSLRERMAKRG